MVNYVLHGLCLSMVLLLIHASQEPSVINPSTESVGSHRIEGKIIIPPGDNALESTRILIDEGLYVGIPQIDGTFVICGRFASCSQSSIDERAVSFRCSQRLVHRLGRVADARIRTRTCRHQRERKDSCT